MHKQILPVAERMAIGFIDAAELGRGPDMGQDTVAGDDPGDIMQVAVVPGRRNGTENSRILGKVSCVPADPEAIAVQRLFAFVAVRALADQGMCGLNEQRVEPDRRTEIDRETAHRLFLRMGTRNYGWQPLHYSRSRYASWPES